MNLLLTFLYGGLFFVLIDYFSNTIQNPAIATLLSAAPLGLIAAFFIKGRTIVECYLRNYSLTCLVTSFLTMIFHSILNNNSILKTNSILIMALFFWFIFQAVKHYCLHKYFPNYLYPF